MKGLSGAQNKRKDNLDLFIIDERGPLMMAF